VVGILVAIGGIFVMAFGIGYFAIFRIGLAVFDRSLRTDVARYGKDQIQKAADKIPSAFVRSVVRDHVVELGGAAAVAIVRNVLKSRMQTGFSLAAVGLMLFIASFYTGTWLPLISMPN
jgi:hypothetical protein